MSSWSIVTLKVDDSSCVYDEMKEPTGMVIDSGIDEQGWIEEDVYYALSYGRYQERRFDAFLEDMHCPKFTGVSRAVVSNMNDTSDKVTSKLYKPKQRIYKTRKDGYEPVDESSGSIFPDEEVSRFKSKIGEEWGIVPVIEPPETTVPPDMVAIYEE